jgi:gas vesicle protein
VGKDPAAIRSEIEQTREDLGETMEAIGYKTDVKARAEDYVQEKKDAVTSKVQGAKEAIVGAKDSVASKVGDVAPSREGITSTARRGKGLAQENPIGLAVASAAVGFLVGLVIPSTRVEDERIGPMADEVKERAKETGGEAIERGKHIAQEAGQQALETARETGKEEGQSLAESMRSQIGETRSRQAEDQGPAEPGPQPQNQREGGEI